jgi:hypothetical protein
MNVESAGILKESVKGIMRNREACQVCLLVASEALYPCDNLPNFLT